MKNQPVPLIVLIDANHYVHRAFHALPPLTTKQGEQVGAVFGFVRTLLKVIKQFSPSHIALCWDSKPSARLEVDPQYKAHRPPTPDELRSQMTLSRELIAAWGIPQVIEEGAEADDLMATLARQARDRGFEVVLVSSDKDLFQLINERTRVYIEHKDEFVDAAAVKKKYGVTVAQLQDYFALIGDSTDNIPGVPGIGPKTAAQLLVAHRDLSSAISAAQIGSESISPKIREKILAAGDRLAANRTLVRLDEKLNVSFDPDAFAFRTPRSEEFWSLLARLGFSSLIRDFERMGWRAESSAPWQTFRTPDDFLVLDGHEPPVPEIFARLSNGLRWIVAEDWKKWLHGGPNREPLRDAAVLDVRLMAWVLDPTQVSFAPDWLMNNYNAQGIGALAERLKSNLEQEGLWKLYADLEKPLIPVLFEMERVGIAVDKGRLERLGHKWEAQLNQLHDEFLKETNSPDDLNLNSPKQLSWLLFEKLKLPVIKKIKTGYSTDEEVLRRLAPMNPAVAKLLSHRELAKLRSTYVHGLLAAINPATGRIHPTFQQEGTETGRLSCANPNLQNIPVRSGHGLDIREAFIPAQSGWVFLGLDYSQIELRVFAHLSGDETMIRCFQRGLDFHEETSRILARPGETASASELRRRAKAVNFGILYGMGAWGLARELGIGDDEAKAFIEAYYARFPRVQAWRQQAIEDARQKGFAVTLFGRKRTLANINAERRDLREFSERAAVNTPIQGSSADMIKKSMVEVANYIRDKGLELRLLLQVHDELLLEGPSAEIEKHAGAIKAIMEKSFPLKVPVAVHVKTGPNWKDMAA